MTILPGHRFVAQENFALRCESDVRLPLSNGQASPILSRRMRIRNEGLSSLHGRREEIMEPFRLSAEQRRYFYALCSTGNITQAARRLYLSRQGLSRSMRGLEEAVGAILFTR